MRIIEATYESTEISEYNFLGCVLAGLENEPLTFRHEYYKPEEKIKQSLYIFGKRMGEKGTQLFVHKYFDYLTNNKFDEDLSFYKLQANNFKLSDKAQLTRDYLLTEIPGEKHSHQFMTKDGKYRRRIVYEIKGDRNALLIVFSLDSTSFSSNQLFKFIKNNLTLSIE